MSNDAMEPNQPDFCRRMAAVHWFKTARLFCALLWDERVSWLRKLAFVVIGVGVAVLGADALFDTAYAMIPLLDLASPIIDPLEALIEGVGILPVLLGFFPEQIRREHIARLFS